VKYPEDSIQSQYAASQKIRALIDAMNLRIDPGVDIELFYAKIIDIYTAEGWGLDNWGRILGSGRLLQVEPGDHFGFADSGLNPFDQGAFYYPGLTNNYYLADPAYRDLLLFKALANISPSDCATLNRLLGRFFNGGTYVVEVAPMEICFVFEFVLSAYQRSLLRLDFIPPHPAGVGYVWLEAPPESTFGFCGAGLQPFEQGTFNRGPHQPA
jgi:hypothetical protein